MGNNTVSLSWAEGEISRRDAIIDALKAELEEIRIDRVTMYNPVQDEENPAPPAAEPDAVTVKESLTVQLFERIAKNHRRWAAYARILAKACGEALKQEYIEQAAEMERDAAALRSLRAAGGVPVDDGKREQAIQRRNDYVRRMNQMLETILDDSDSLEWIIANDPTVLEKLRALLPAPPDAKGGE